jgi:hypothetical protein
MALVHETLIQPDQISARVRQVLLAVGKQIYPKRSLIKIKIKQKHTECNSRLYETSCYWYYRQLEAYRQQAIGRQALMLYLKVAPWYILVVRHGTLSHDERHTSVPFVAYLLHTKHL